MKHDRIVEYTTIAVASALEPGERIELASRVQVGQVSVRSNLVLGMVVAVLTLGAITVYRVPKVLYLVLTDRRLLFLEPHDVSGRPTTMVSLECPRGALTVGPVTPGHAALVRRVSRVRLTGTVPDGSRTELLLTFHGACRQDAPRLAAALLPAHARS